MRFPIHAGLIISGTATVAAAPAYASNTNDVIIALQIGSQAANVAALRSGAEIARQRALLAQKEQETRRALNRAGIAEREARDLRAELTVLHTQIETLIGEMAQRDAEFAVAIKSYTDGLRGLLDKNNAQISAALERYASGDDSVLAELPQLTEVITSASAAGAQARVDAALEASKAQSKANARLWRSTALVLADGRERGKVSTEQVLAAWETAASYDPDVHFQWEEIARLEAQLGRDDKASAALGRAMSTAKGDMEKAGTLLLYQSGLYGAPPGYPATVKPTEEALALYRHVLADNPDNPYVQGQVLSAIDLLASQQNNEASRDMMTGQPASPEALAEPRKLLDDANPIAEMLLKRFPDDNEAARLAWSHFRTSAEIALGQRRYDDAAALYTRSTNVARQISARLPTGRRLQYFELRNLRDLALLADLNGDVKGARAALDTYMQACRTIWLSDPSNVFSRSDLWHAYTSLGTVDQSNGDFAAAAADYQRAVEVGQATKSFPAVTYMVSLTLPRLAQAQSFVGDFAAAEAALRANAAFRDQQPPDMEHPKSDALSDRFGMAEIAFRARRYDLAISRFADFEAAIARTNPDGEITQADLDQFHYLHDFESAELLLEKGDIDAAIVAYKRSLSTVEEVSKRDPSNVSARLSVLFVQIILLDLTADNAGWPALVREFEKLTMLPPSRTVRADYVANALALARERSKISIDTSGPLQVRRIASVKATLAAAVSLDKAETGDGYFATVSAHFMAVLARLPGSGVSWADVATQYRDMVARHLIGPDPGRAIGLGFALLRERQIAGAGKRR